MSELNIITLTAASEFFFILYSFAKKSAAHNGARKLGTGSVPCEVGLLFMFFIYKPTAV